jgi:hypothetical protein
MLVPRTRFKPDGTDGHPIAADVHDEQHLPDSSPDGMRLVFTVRGGEPIVLVPGGIYGHGAWQPPPAAM